MKVAATLRTFVAIASLLLVAAPAAADTPTVHALKPTFYVTVEGSSSTSISDVVVVASAQEFQKLIDRRFPPPDPQNPDHVFAAAGAPWVVPLLAASDGTAAIAARCADDPQTIGGVVLSYYTGYATHYYLLWQSETTTFDLIATLIKCDDLRSAPQASTASPAPAPAGTPVRTQTTIVGVIDQLPNSNGTPWIVRRTQISIPLLTFAALTTLLTPTTTGKTTNLTAIGLAGSLFGGASSKDVPGYSDPVRLRAAARHIADDVVGAGSVLCRTTYDVAPDAYEQRAAFCKALGFTTASTP